jgi:hypothetical protein
MRHVVRPLRTASIITAALAGVGFSLAVVGLFTPVRTSHCLIENGSLQLRWGSVDFTRWDAPPVGDAMYPIRFSVVSPCVDPIGPLSEIKPVSTSTLSLNLVCPSILLAAGSLLMLLYRRWLPTPPGGCLRCGYDLTGNTSDVCPECGGAV